MGGAALTHASDLDLIFLFTGDYRAESDGERPLGAVTYYNRLAQRVIGALSAPTASGPLYEIDTRLRPSGGQGPLVVSLEGFRLYQEQEAWTWEHMALCRARTIFGSLAARTAVSAVVTQVLEGARPARDIVADATSMFDLVGPDGTVHPSARSHEILLASLHAGFATVLTTDRILHLQS